SPKVLTSQDSATYSGNSCSIQGPQGEVVPHYSQGPQSWSMPFLPKEAVFFNINIPNVPKFKPTNFHKK
ncbi:hypothetical protein ACQP3J_26755, partial [Escherichia coli]